MINFSEEEFAESVRVVTGNPTDEELAAVIAVLSESAKAQRRAVGVPKSSWSKNHGMLRDSLVAGNGQWGSSYKPGL